MFREVIGIPSFYVMLYRARQGRVQPRRHCKHKRDKNPDNPAWSLGCCSLTREVLSSIAEYRSPDLSPGKQRSRRGELTTERWLVKWTLYTGVRVNFRCVARLQVQD